MKEHRVSSNDAGFLDRWSEVLSREFAGKTVTPADSSRFAAFARSMPATEGLQLSRVQSLGASIAHEQQHIANQGDGNIIVHFQLSGVSRNSQAGREAVLEPNDFTLVDTTRPYSISFAEPTDIVVVKLPRAIVDNKLFRAEDFVSYRMSGSSGGGLLFTNFIREFWAQAEHGDWSRFDHEVGETCSQLLSLACRPFVLDHPLNATRKELQWRAVCGFVESNFRSPLNAAIIGAELGMSERHVQSLFTGRGLTIGLHLRKLRLNYAAKLLASPAHRGRGIMDICLDSGFADLSHFNRQFRLAFGCTPSSYRIAHLPK
jgi:AraC-like DNA-binding protein